LISRRRFLGHAGALATGLSLDRSMLAAGLALPPEALDPAKLEPFVDPLPLPTVLKSSGTHPDPEHPGKTLPLYRVAMQEIHQKVHRDLPATRMWGFNGSVPGPLFETRSGQGLMVEWRDQLPLKHFLPIDHNLHGAEASAPEVRCTVHVHGGRTPAKSDGYPEDWVVPGKSLLYHYPNQQDAALLFYHDHTMGINRLNIYAGLQGLFLIRDEHEDSLNLPKGRYEIPLMLFDRFLQSDGQLEYPTSGDPKSPWVPEVYSNVMLANGALMPYLDVEPRQYRFRIMNGSNARFFRLSFGNLSEMQIIGSDQGLLPAPVKAKRMLLGPAERTDIVFDFSAHAGEKVVLRNDSFDVMQFRVASAGSSTTTSTSPKQESSLPPALRTIERIPESRAVKTRRMTLDEKMNMVQESMGMLLNNTPWHAPITEKPVLDTTEIWEIVNLTEDTHPIHLHLVKFQILDRRAFDVFLFQDKGELRFTQRVQQPGPEEMGWKDTVRCEKGHVTRIIVPFEGYTGRYVWHCHLLEHEDNEMMRPFEVVKAGQGA
jgi:spore coat protein A, manganese oxidase